MDARLTFKEGWIMLLRPFQFAELEQPLQKMTILYAFSEKPLIQMELNKEGKKELEKLHSYWDKGGKTSLLNHHHQYSIRFGEHESDYNERMEDYYNRIVSAATNVENYMGEVVQAYVEGEMCRFYPEEYNVISKDTFDHILTCNEEEYKIDIENHSYFDMESVKNKLFYIMQRGIGKETARKMVCAEAKDHVIFRPQEAILDMFCREHEIY